METMRDSCELIFVGQLPTYSDQGVLAHYLLQVPVAEVRITMVLGPVPTQRK